MKNLLFISALIIGVLPCAAACPVSGNSCAYSIMRPPLQERYLPDNVQLLQKPDAFRPQYITPYHSELINTETGAAASTQNGSANYNANCQFGICLPGASEGEIME